MWSLFGLLVGVWLHGLKVAAWAWQLEAIYIIYKDIWELWVIAWSGAMFAVGRSCSKYVLDEKLCSERIVKE